VFFGIPDGGQTKENPVMPKINKVVKIYHMGRCINFGHVILCVLQARGSIVLELYRCFIPCNFFFSR
jgi:hypothetical protein